MNLNDTFPWPSPAGTTQRPRWNGGSFDLGERNTRVLVYAVDSSHWSDDLTSLHEAEAGRNHPIDLASRLLAVRSMSRLAASAPVLLDVGCSSGFVLDDLRRALPRAGIIGADYLRGPLESLARRVPDVPLLQFDLRQCPLLDACVDGVTCLNVLEHIDDHGRAIREIFRILKPGGIAHIEVPAGPSLFDFYDEHLMHHRRYRRRELLALTAEAGFAVTRTTHLGFFVFPAFWWVKKRNRRKMTASPSEKARLVARQIRATRINPVFSILTKMELMLGRYVSYPWGIRCVLELRKP